MPMILCCAPSVGADSFCWAARMRSASVKVFSLVGKETQALRIKDKALKVRTFVVDVVFMLNMAVTPHL
jgi:hypothetical protein